MDDSYLVQIVNIRKWWHEDKGDKGLYLGSGVPTGFTSGIGKQIVKNAMRRLHERGKFFVIPFSSEYKNCVIFVREVHESEGIELPWSAITTPASIYETLSPNLWPEFRVPWWFFAPSAWLRPDKPPYDKDWILNNIIFRWL